MLSKYVTLLEIHLWGSLGGCSVQVAGKLRHQTESSSSSSSSLNPLAQLSRQRPHLFVMSHRALIPGLVGEWPNLPAQVTNFFSFFFLSHSKQFGGQRHFQQEVVNIWTKKIEDQTKKKANSDSAEWKVRPEAGRFGPVSGSAPSCPASLRRDWTRSQMVCCRLEYWWERAKSCYRKIMLCLTHFITLPYEIGPRPEPLQLRACLHEDGFLWKGWKMLLFRPCVYTEPVSGTKPTCMLFGSNKK